MRLGWISVWAAGFNMFRASLCPSLGARDYDVDYHIGRFGLGLLYVGACSPDTTPA